ncbi:MAG: hypothetical protein V4508_08795 [Pseudomonadota bacterium]
MATPKPNVGPWDKRGIYLRLSKGRKARLLEIAKDLGHEDSPHRTLSAYIEEPRGGAGKPRHENQGLSLDGLDDFEELNELLLAISTRLDGLAGAVAQMERRMTETLGQVGDSLAPLRALISGGAASSPPIESLTHWLARLQSERARPINRVALVRATWRTTKAVDGSPSEIAMEFGMCPLSIDGLPLKPGHLDLVLIDGLEATGRMVTAVQTAPTSPVILACQPNGVGQWSIAVFAQNPDESLGDQLSILAIG